MINILDHTGFIRKYVYKITKKIDVAKEFEQIGYLALLEAKERFNPELSNNFLSYGGLYAIGRIKQYIRDNIEKHSIASVPIQEDDLQTERDALDEELDKEKQIKKIYKYLEYSVKPKNREAFKAVYLNTNTTQNVAKEQHITEGVVRLKAHNTKKNMIKYFRELNERS